MKMSLSPCAAALILIFSGIFRATSSPAKINSMALFLTSDDVRLGSVGNGPTSHDLPQSSTTGVDGPTLHRGEHLFRFPVVRLAFFAISVGRNEHHVPIVIFAIQTLTGIFRSGLIFPSQIPSELWRSADGAIRLPLLRDYLFSVSMER